MRNSLFGKVHSSKVGHLHNVLVDPFKAVTLLVLGRVAKDTLFRFFAEYR